MLCFTAGLFQWRQKRQGTAQTINISKVNSNREYLVTSLTALMLSAWCWNDSTGLLKTWSQQSSHFSSSCHKCYLCTVVLREFLLLHYLLRYQCQFHSLMWQFVSGFQQCCTTSHVGSWALPVSYVWVGYVAGIPGGYTTFSSLSFVVIVLGFLKHRYSCTCCSLFEVPLFSVWHSVLYTFFVCLFLFNVKVNTFYKHRWKV